ncbi:MAG: hypothetical protein DCC58_13660 [Chloroflexi bacterium]|nr:MAG: hypothetical protein DCC58_13660 [Chloroflexota bacterium]
MLYSLRIPAALTALCLLVLAAIRADAVAPGNAAFQRTWERTDQPVLAGVVARTWMWGPEANTQPILEEYAESPNGLRTVQYFDKARMEITYPGGDQSSVWYVTNGLLVVELMTGRLQVGDNTFRQYAPALVNVAGDADDPNGPTYATMAALRTMPPYANGATITTRVDRNGNLTNDPALAAYGVTAAHRVTVPGIDHQVASPFWAFMNSSGTVYKPSLYVDEPLFLSAFYATGYPVTEAYWATVRVGGTLRLVLLQCFERRCLTYTPGNPPGFLTEAGNVGQHYHYWRYVEITGGSPTATSTRTPTATSHATEPPPTTTGVAPSASATATGSDISASPSTTSTSTSTSTSTATATTTPDTATQYAYAGQVGGGLLADFDFEDMYGVSIAEDGTVYLVDNVTHRVYAYTPNGRLIDYWGGAGSGNGQFQSPYDIVVDDDGMVYVTDTDNNRVQKFDSDGDFIRTWGSLGDEEGEFQHPYGIDVDDNGNVYVADIFRVQVFSSTGEFLRSFADEDDDAPVDTPLGLEVRGNRVYSSSNSVSVYSTAGEYLTSWGTGMNFPVGIDSGDNGNLYIVDNGNGRVRVFDPDGEFLYDLGRQGNERGEFASPAYLGVSASGRVYVSDGSKVVVFREGDDQEEFYFEWNGATRGRFLRPEGLVILADGSVAIVDNGRRVVERFNQNGGYLGEFGQSGDFPWFIDDPAHIAGSQQGSIYVVERGEPEVSIYGDDELLEDSIGSGGSGNGQFDTPVGIDVDGAGNVYVSDSELDRVQKFNPSGGFTLIFGASGDGPGELTEPRGLAVNGSLVYVVDAGNNRIQVFETDGDYVGGFGSSGDGPGEFNSPNDIAIDADGYVYVSDGLNDRVQKFTWDGDWIASFGTKGSGQGQFITPVGIDVASNGYVWVVDQGNDRVLVFRPAN